jgi:hypothetical protein
LITKFSQAFSAYKELIETGGIQCTAEGEKVSIDIKGNLTGDLLVFIGPAYNTASPATDINTLLSSDSELEQLRKLVFKSLKQKYKGLSLLPESLVWIINIGLTALYISINSHRIYNLLAGETDLSGILLILPLVFFTAVTLFLGKAIGFKVMKPVLSLIVGIARFYRKLQNRNVEKQQSQR